MMVGSHLVLGTAAWMAAASWLGQEPLAVLPLLAAAAGSLLPDIDHPKSWLGRRTRPLSDLIAAVSGHRGITHSLAAAAGIVWLLGQEGAHPLLRPAAIGYLTHLAADLLTPGGLRLAWPLRGNWSLPLCKAGGPGETLVVAAVLAWMWCQHGERSGLPEAFHAVSERLEAAFPLHAETAHQDPQLTAHRRVASLP